MTQHSGADSQRPKALAPREGAAPEPQSVPRLQYLLVRKTTASHEYDPDHALDFWRVVAPWVPNESPWQGYGEADWRDDEDRIIGLFELLEGSMLCDMIFGSLADDDHGCELVKRWDDE